MPHRKLKLLFLGKHGIYGKHAEGISVQLEDLSKAVRNKEHSRASAFGFAIGSKLEAAGLTPGQQHAFRADLQSRYKRALLHGEVTPEIIRRIVMEKYGIAEPEKQKKAMEVLRRAGASMAKVKLEREKDSGSFRETIQISMKKNLNALGMGQQNVEQFIKDLEVAEGIIEEFEQLKKGKGKR